MELQLTFKHVRKKKMGVSICLSNRHVSKVNYFSSTSLKPYSRNDETQLFKIERKASILIIVSHYFLPMDSVMPSRTYLTLNTFKHIFKLKLFDSQKGLDVVSVSALWSWFSCACLHVRFQTSVLQSCWRKLTIGSESSDSLLLHIFYIY